ncbi:MAG: hypothetical protein H0W83_15730 [Planctomycetes bacterium]|nr:hypothetical protein [Planctomycetota bacterium]
MATTRHRAHATRRSALGGALVLAVLTILAAVGLPLARLCHAAEHQSSMHSGVAVSVAPADDEATCLLCQNLSARVDVAALDDVGAPATVSPLIGTIGSSNPIRAWSAPCACSRARGPPAPTLN